MNTRLATFATRGGVLVALIGGCGLAGWILGVDSLKAIYGPITMKANAAIAFLLCGTALAFRRRSPRVSALLAGTAAVIGGLTLIEHAVGVDFGIDQLLFVEPPGSIATASPNRMGPNASTSFTLAGLALLLLRRGDRNSVRIGQSFAFVGLAFACLALAGYVYGAVELYGIAQFTGIAMPTAVGFLLLHAGILLSDTAQGPMAIFGSESLGGTLLRRLTVWVVAFPLLFGLFEVNGRAAEVFDRGLGMALLIVSIVAVLLAMLWQTARVIERADDERREARQQAERANELKDQFIAMLSHELRTPLNVMLGRLRLLERDPDVDARKRAAAIAARNGRLLARLVEDLLDLSRASVGQFEIAPAPAQLNTIVRNTVDTIGVTAADKGVMVTTALDPNLPVVHIDQHRIQQVVLNLLSNAVRFTGPNGVVSIRTLKQGDTVTVTVADTGIGFDAPFAAELFEPFRQADASSRRQHGGLGLGLSIARHLAEAHGGSLTGTSPGSGKGATFVLTLPATPLPSGELGPSGTHSDTTTVIAPPSAVATN